VIKHICLTALFLAACASVGERGSEPRHVVLRNVSGVDLQTLTVREPRSEQPARLGTISPALNGHSYSFARRPDGPPLPKQAIVVWTTRGGGKGSALANLEEALARSTGAADEAIFFELRPGGRVAVYLGTAPRSMYG